MFATIMDLDGDGVLDLLQLRNNGKAEAFNIVAANEVAHTTAPFTSSLADKGGPGFAAPLASDGKVHLFLRRNDVQLWIRASHNSPTYSPSLGLSLSARSYKGTDGDNTLAWASACDLDGDGDLDVIDASYSTPVLVDSRNTDQDAIQSVVNGFERKPDEVTLIDSPDPSVQQWGGFRIDLDRVAFGTDFLEAKLQTTVLESASDACAGFQVHTTLERNPSSLDENPPRDLFSRPLSSSFSLWNPPTLTAGELIDIDFSVPLRETITSVAGHDHSHKLVIILKPTGSSSCTRRIAGEDSNGVPNPTFSITVNGAPAVWEHIGLGSLTFARAYNLPGVSAKGRSTQNIKCLDADHDGKLDLLVFQNDQSSPAENTLFLHNVSPGGSGSFAFTSQPTWLTANTQSKRGAVGDLDNDGDMDFASTRDNQLYVWENHLSVRTNDHLIVRATRVFSGINPSLPQSDPGASITLLTCAGAWANIYASFIPMYDGQGQDAPYAHFGLRAGGASLVWRVRVAFTNGSVVDTAVRPSDLPIPHTLNVTASDADDLSLCATCGNGIVEASEACDDGNLVSGDGCSLSCALEPGYVCPVPDSPCSLAPDYCPDLPPPASGSRSSITRTLGGDALFACNDGYTLSGSSSRTCNVPGTWSGSDTVCTLNPSYCSVLSPTPNSALTSCDRFIAGQCTFACDTGYLPSSGSSTRTCQAPGGLSWTGSQLSCVCDTSHCPTLSPPTNGALSGPAGPCTAGSGACLNAACGPMVCSNGYALTGGPATRTCLLSGSWSDSEPTCDLIPTYCPSLTPPAQGSLAACTRSLGGSCSFSCDPGYTLSDPTPLSCNDDTPTMGVWSGPVPTCDPIPNYCDASSIVPLNGSASTCATFVGASCTIECDEGFNLVGTASRVCNPPGGPSGWSDATPSCQPIPDYCPGLSPPVDGSLGPCPTTIGSVCGPFSCDPGLSLSGSPYRTCTSGSVWSGTPAECGACQGNCATCTSTPSECLSCIPGYTGEPTCTDLIPDFCGDLTPPTNGVFSAYSRTRGGVATVSCNAGYSRVGTASRTCLESTAWSGSSTATCVPNPCVPPVLPPPTDGTASPSGTGVTGDSTSFACNAGYSLAGSATRTCTTDSSWDGNQPTCSPVSCPTLSSPPPNVVLSATTGVYQDVVTLSCTLGHAFSPSSARAMKCTAGGSWNVSLSTPSVECLPLPCPTLSAPSFGTVSRLSGSVGDTATYTCNTGYSLGSFAPTRTCLASQTWSPPPPPSCSGLPCATTLSPPANGAVSITTGVTGDSATYSCDPGYNLIGATSTLCQTNSAWSNPAPTCSLISCSVALNPPENGGISCSDGSNFGSVCTYQCLDPYTLFGTSTRSCLATGAWSGLDDSYCSDTSPDVSTLGSPSPLTAIAGQVPVFVMLRSSLGDPIVHSRDVLGFTSLDPAYTFPSPPSYFYSGANGNHTLLGLFTTAGSYTYQVSVNSGVLDSASTYQLIILPSTVDGSSSTAQGEGLTQATIGSAAPVVVTLRDEFGNPLTSGGIPGLSVVAEFKASLTGELVDVTVTDRGDGTWSVFYVPLVGGLYSLSINVEIAPGFPGVSGGIQGSPWVLVVESNCPPGEYSVETASPCVLCAPGTYSDVFGSLSCTPCPVATTSAEGAQTLNNCTCQAGFWRTPEAEAAGTGACASCPIGASCAGGGSRPVSLPGYVPGSTLGSFVECTQNRAACIGGGACARGYEGALCARCQKGWYALQSKCFECRRGQSGLVLTAFVVGAFLLAAFLIVVNKSQKKVYGMASLVIGLNSLQIAALYGDLDLDWPPVAQSLLSALTFFNLNVELTSPECSVDVPNPWLMKFVFTMLLPLVFAGVFAICYAIGCLYIYWVKKTGRAVWDAHPEWKMDESAPWIVRRWRRFRCVVVIGYRALRDACIRAYCHMTMLLYLPLTAASFAYWRCSKIEDGSYVMTNFPARKCYDSDYWNMASVAAIFGLVYGVGIPVGTLLFLLRLKRKLLIEELYLRYAFLVDRFTSKWYVWEVLIMLRKCGVVLCVVAFRNAYTAAAAISILLLVLLVFLAQANPYRIRAHNLVAVGVLSATVVVMIGASLTGSSELKVVVVVGGLLVSLVVIVAGICYDIYVLQRVEKEEEQQFDMLFGSSVNHDEDGVVESEMSVTSIAWGQGVEMDIVSDDDQNNNNTGSGVFVNTSTDSMSTINDPLTMSFIDSVPATTTTM